jgi:Holliday junction resolvase-like predicted endonuclease
VTVEKQRRIRQLAVEWLRAHELRADSIRFDVVAITGTELELLRRPPSDPQSEWDIWGLTPEASRRDSPGERPDEQARDTRRAAATRT